MEQRVDGKKVMTLQEYQKKYPNKTMWNYLDEINLILYPVAGHDYSNSPLAIRSSSQGTRAPGTAQTTPATSHSRSPRKLHSQTYDEQLIQPAMRAHAQAIDAYLAALYVDIPNLQIKQIKHRR